MYKVPGAMIHKRRLIVSYENVIKHIQVNTASLIRKKFKNNKYLTLFYSFSATM